MDLISRQAAYETLSEYYHHSTEIQHKGLREALSRVPSAEPEYTIEMQESDIDEAVKRVRDARVTILPSAEPVRMKGKWIEKEVHENPKAAGIEEWQSCKCSVCGRYDTKPYIYFFDEPHYCSWCGADMRGEEDALN